MGLVSVGVSGSLMAHFPGNLVWDGSAHLPGNALADLPGDSDWHLSGNLVANLPGHGVADGIGHRP